MNTAVAPQPEIVEQQPDWDAALDKKINHLSTLLASYLNPVELEEICQACYFGAEAHAGVTRKTGEPYIFHPISVAEILQEVKVDKTTIIAAILHDVIEDTHFNKEDIANRFGNEVAELVDGVTKLAQIKNRPKEHAQAESFHKMCIAMVRDIRVIMIKLADRLHNMRTLGIMPPYKRRRIARETLQLYAPMAFRLGMNHVRLELEELGFQNKHPWRYAVIQAALARTVGRREQFLGLLETKITERLNEVGLNARVQGRTKHLWSIYRKMQDKKLRFKDITDIYAVRVIVDKPDECYRTLGYLHHLYKPMVGRFKDYIASPKDNGYQSLHTVLIGPKNKAVEAQIRTRDMHVVAETGVAAHWIYKAKNADKARDADLQTQPWLQKLKDIQRRTDSSLDFMENVKIDLFPNEVYVYTPDGTIKELPRGATVVDFAYAIHSDVGNTCIGGKVNSRMVPLSTQLLTGQTVEVIISPTGRPDPAWLNFVVTGRARTSIRHFLNNLRREDAVILGRRLLDKALTGGISRLKQMEPDKLQTLVEQLNASSIDDILADIGLGKRIAPIVAKHFLGESTSEQRTRNNNDAPLLIKGTEGAVVSFGKCCHPIPGDDIIAHLSSGRGIVIHRTTCGNVAAFEKAPDKWLEVEWVQNIQAEFETELRLRLVDRRGLLAAVASALADVGVNIEHIKTSKGDSGTTWVDLVISVSGREQLARIIKRLRMIDGSQRVVRVGTSLHK